MNITIIGANSYIARNLINQLKNGVDRLILYDYQNEHKDGMSNYFQVNLLNREEVSKISFDVDIIYNFVGLTGSGRAFEFPNDYIDVNEKVLLNILCEYVDQKSEAKLIFPSTRLVYKGKSGKLTEDSPKEFKTIYAMNKYSCEQYIEMYHRLYNLKYTIFRICVPYGTLVKDASSYGTAEIFLSKALKKEDITVYGTGEQRRTLTYIGDLCRALIEGAKSEETDNNIYNIGGEDYSLFEMASFIAKSTGVNVVSIEWPENAKIIESGDTVFDSERLDCILGPYISMSFEMWVKSLANSEL